MKLNGLTGQTFSDVLEEEQEKPKYGELAILGKEFITTSSDDNEYLAPFINSPMKPSVLVEIPNQSCTDVQVLDEKVKSMMERGQKMIPDGKQANGIPKQKTSYICKVCGKEDNFQKI